MGSREDLLADPIIRGRLENPSIRADDSSVPTTSLEESPTNKKQINRIFFPPGLPNRRERIDRSDQLSYTDQESRQSASRGRPSTVSQKQSTDVDSFQYLTPTHVSYQESRQDVSSGRPSTLRPRYPVDAESSQSFTPTAASSILEKYEYSEDELEREQAEDWSNIADQPMIGNAVGTTNCVALGILLLSDAQIDGCCCEDEKTDNSVNIQKTYTEKSGITSVNSMLWEDSEVSTYTSNPNSPLRRRERKLSFNSVTSSMYDDYTPQPNSPIRRRETKPSFNSVTSSMYDDDYTPYSISPRHIRSEPVFSTTEKKHHRRSLSQQSAVSDYQSTMSTSTGTTLRRLRSS